jgi:N,N'-diacetyllegionaminate synthase
MRKSVVIIAEAGVNHNGSLENALELIRLGAEAGVDYVKFQSFKAENLVSNQAKKAEYQQQNAPTADDSQLNMLKKLEIQADWYPVLLEACAKYGVHFLSTGFDTESLALLKELEIPFYKVPSGEITNKPYLLQIAAYGKPIILSTGMANLEEIRAAMNVLIGAGVAKHDITILHCNTEYPTPMEDVHLRAMQTIRDTFGVEVGYSDHTLGIEIPIAAVALGAQVIEKHFTLDRRMEGPDHAASLEPADLKAMVQGIRNIEKALGSPEKKPSPSETPNIAIARKSIHLVADLQQGVVLKASDLIMLRPGNGISPMDMDQVIGKTLKQALAIQTQLQWSDFE